MVNIQNEVNTEQKILKAARDVFIRKGMAGARMQDIANEAGINKALLHYYFRSKEKLFETVFWEAANELFFNLNKVFQSDRSLFDKIECLISEYLDLVIKAPFIPQFLFSEINRNPESFFRKMEQLTGKPDPSPMLLQFKEAMDKGLIRKEEPLQFMMNIMSMIVFPFIGKPMFQKMFSIADTEFYQMMEERKKIIVDFVINAIKLESE